MVAADLDDDGRIDLFVANDLSANFLCRNLGGFRFEEVGHAAGVAASGSGGYQAGMGVGCGDVDGDGRPDLAVTNFYGEATTLYQNLGQGSSTTGPAPRPPPDPRTCSASGSPSSTPTTTAGSTWSTANGHVNDFRPEFPYAMPAQLFLGGPDGRLTDVSDRGRATRCGPTARPRPGRRRPRQRRPARPPDRPAWTSPWPTSTTGPHGGHYLTLRLEGTASNRDAVGARVTVTAGGRRARRRRLGGGSYQSAADPRLHFGLGDADRVESVEVRWPSGRVDRLGPVPADAGYLIREGAPRAEPLRGVAAGMKVEGWCWW